MKWLVVLLVACGPGLAPQAPKPAARTQLVGGPAALRKMMRDAVTNGGLYFDDPACARQFATGGEVPSDQLDAFARCVGRLGLVVSAREDALPDVVVLEYAPGFELEARVTPDGQLAWIGFASRIAGDPDVPTVTHAALESLRLAGDRDAAPDPEVARTLALDADPVSPDVHTWFKICLDTAGAMTRTDAYETTSSGATKAFRHGIAAWKFRPFITRGAAIPVCALVRLAYPAAATKETLPLPPPPSRSKKRPVVLATSKLIEARRISGETQILPDDVDKLRIYETRRAQPVVGVFRLCVDDAGAVESVLPVRSTGIAGYDAKLVRTMHDWRYTPYRVDDEPVPVCTSIEISYTQRARPRVVR